MVKEFKFKMPVSDIGEHYDTECITAVSSNIRCMGDQDKGERNWYYRGPLLMQTLIDTSADIIGLQEVKPEAFDAVISSLKGYASFIDYRDDSDEPEGCPILYNTAKFSAERRGAFWLSETPEVMSKGWDAACYRICSYAVLEEKSSGKRLAVFNTHLDHVSEKARINGIRLILDKLGEFGGMPCVIMGDMNDTEDSETYKSAVKLFDDAKYRTDDTDSGATYHEWGSLLDNENIDYFLVSKEGLEILQYRVIRTSCDGVYPSDHFPIKLKMRLV